MASAVIFLEVPEQTWHYDPTLDSLVLVAYSSFKLYIFFSRPFSIPIVSQHFDSHRPFADLSLCLSHLPQFLEPAPSASLMETNPLEGSSPHFVLHVVEFGSSAASTKVLPEMQPEEDPGERVLENEFNTPQAYAYIMGQAFCYIYTYGFWVNKLMSTCLCQIALIVV